MADLGQFSELDGRTVRAVFPGGFMVAFTVCADALRMIRALDGVFVYGRDEGKTVPVTLKIGNRTGTCTVDPEPAPGPGPVSP